MRSLSPRSLDHLSLAEPLQRGMRLKQQRSFERVLALRLLFVGVGFGQFTWSVSQDQEGERRGYGNSPFMTTSKFLLAFVLSPRRAYSLPSS